jgi:hypothetical protein
MAKMTTVEITYGYHQWAVRGRFSAAARDGIDGPVDLQVWLPDLHAHLSARRTFN